MNFLALVNCSKNFPVKFYNIDALKKDTQYMYALHPHGLLTLTKLLHFSDIHSPLFPFWKNSRHAAHSGIFKIPFIREAALLFNSIPVEKNIIKEYIDKGTSITLYPGGAREVQFAKDDAANKDILYLKNRKGFIKICLEKRIPVVPVYCWGEQQILTHDSRLKGLNAILSTLFQYTIDLHVLQIYRPINIYQIFKIAFGEKEVSTTTYVGEPIMFEQGVGVDEAHSIYVNKLKELYEWAAKDKGSSRQLVIQ